MVAKRLGDGRTAYYWRLQQRDIAAGCPVHSEPLGFDYAEAMQRAALLNRQLDAWRRGLGATVPRSLDRGAKFGSVEWLFETYRRSAAYERVSARTRPVYEGAMKRITDTPTTVGGTVGELPALSVSPAAVDKLYAKLLEGPRGRRPRQANISVAVAKRAWDVVHRSHPKLVPANNPWKGVLKVASGRTKPAATREQAYALAYKLRELGEPHLGAAALICFEWLQRPENVLAGKITWADYRPSDRPGHVRVFHHKTGEIVWMPLEDEDGPLYPELEAFLAPLPRRGVPIVVTAGERGPPRLYSSGYWHRRVREARSAAGLPADVTLDSCRHGGMTELGDAELTEQGVMTLSGHKTPNAARLYIKRTERQRLSAARKRREWVETNKAGTDVGMAPGGKSRNDVEGSG